MFQHISEKRTPATATGSRDQKQKEPLAEPCNPGALLAGVSASLAAEEPYPAETEQQLTFGAMLICFRSRATRQGKVRFVGHV